MFAIQPPRERERFYEFVLLFDSGFGFLRSILDLCCSILDLDFCCSNLDLDLCCSIYGDEACVVLRVVVLVSDACVVVLFWVGFEIEGEGVFFIRMNNE
ncbi:hypothetical protein QL285_054132 [Trifolium repens]|nr:hypothetical protein QL285_054132 [Trifolium repens]